MEGRTHSVPHGFMNPEIVICRLHSTTCAKCFCFSRLGCYMMSFHTAFQLLCEWAQIQVILLTNDGNGFGFGISGSRNSGAVVRNIFPGGAADKASSAQKHSYY